MLPAESSWAYLAALVTSSGDAIVSQDLNGLITSWNVGAERLFGYRPGDVIGRSITLLLPANRRREALQTLDRIRRGDVVLYETFRRRMDGRLLEVSIRVSPIRNGTGEVIGVSEIFRTSPIKN
jgi:PAS domain S-box-containing protein